MHLKIYLVNMWNEFDFGDFEITKREILASVTIVIIMLLIGVLISNKISEHQLDLNEMYNKAVKIDSKDMFEYGMRTNIGNAFVHGEMRAVDTVTYPEIGGNYIYVEKVKEQYTMHTRTVTYTTGSGDNIQTHTRVETYWTWDVVDNENIRCKEISLLGVAFDSYKFEIPQTTYIDTINESGYIRYQYYGVGPKHIVTIFTNLKDNTFSNSRFFFNKSIQESIDYLQFNGKVIIFWIFWIIAIFAVLYGFFYIDNKWLE